MFRKGREYTGPEQRNTSHSFIHMVFFLLAQQAVWSIFKQNDEYATCENRWQNTMAVEGQRGQVTQTPRVLKGTKGEGETKKERDGEGVKNEWDSELEAHHRILTKGTKDQ